MFTCLAIFTSIQNPMRSLPTTFDIIMETITSMKRIENFLKLPEIQNNRIIKNDLMTKNNGIAIQIINGSFKWGKIELFSKEQKKEVLSIIPKDKIESKNIELSKIPSKYQPLPNINKDESKLYLDYENENYFIKYKDSKTGETFPQLSPRTDKTNMKFFNFDNTATNKLKISINESTKIINDEGYLKNINLTVKQGEFICIIGEVGSGKSSLIQADLII